MLADLDRAVADAETAAVDAARDGVALAARAAANVVVNLVRDRSIAAACALGADERTLRRRRRRWWWWWWW